MISQTKRVSMNRGHLTVVAMDAANHVEAYATKANSNFFFVPFSRFIPTDYGTSSGRTFAATVDFPVHVAPSLPSVQFHPRRNIPTERTIAAEDIGPSLTFPITSIYTIVSVVLVVNYCQSSADPSRYLLLIKCLTEQPCSPNQLSI